MEMEKDCAVAILALNNHEAHDRTSPLPSASFSPDINLSKMGGKSDEQVIEEFNELVNMSVPELEKWLASESSQSAGWGNEGGGESVGHDSGRRIVDILKRNPKKDPSKYTEEDLEHMRKVASYIKRHIAQEGHMKQTKSKEELEESRSVRSLRNWGHNMI